MSNDANLISSRREFLHGAGGIVAATALPKLMLPNVHVAGSELIQVALVGCGGRGGGAAVNAVSTTSGPIKLVAMADVFSDRMDSCYNNLQGAVAAKMDVPKSRQFLGFDAYKKAMDCLKPGDVVILTTPLAFRWVHFKYAIDKKLNVFMEKPLTADGPSSKKMLALADEAAAANLKVGVGLMSRHSHALQELQKRVQDGELGDIILMRGYRMHGPAAYSETEPRPSNQSELEFQIRRFHSFLWASGGMYNDFYIHHIDHLSWMKNDWPVSAQAIGAKQKRVNDQGQPLVDQNFDMYSVEYTFPDGTKMLYDGRCMNGAEERYSSYLHGSKGYAIAARANDCSGPSAIYKDQNGKGSPSWQSNDNTNPYQNEWDELVLAIRNDKKYSEVRRGVYASLAGSMGRMAAHTGQLITMDQMLNCPHEFAPGIDKWMSMDENAPIMADANGRYPIPQPGVLTDREY